MIFGNVRAIHLGPILDPTTVKLGTVVVGLYWMFSGCCGSYYYYVEALDLPCGRYLVLRNGVHYIDIDISKMKKKWRYSSTTNWYTWYLVRSSPQSAHR